MVVLDLIYAFRLAGLALVNSISHSAPQLTSCRFRQVNIGAIFSANGGTNKWKNLVSVLFLECDHGLTYLVRIDGIDTCSIGLEDLRTRIVSQVTDLLTFH